MAQQQSPWLEGAYGWDFGEGGWNTGMDQNLLKFSFMFDRNVDSIVSSLPVPVNGEAHYLTTDNRLYFAVGTTYFSTPVPKWFEFKDRSTGDTYQFNGTSVIQIDSPAQVDTRLDDIELTVSNLGTAAFEDVEFFATQAELDIVEAAGQTYTDVLRSDLASDDDLTKGAGQIGFDSSLDYPMSTIGAAVKDIVASLGSSEISVRDYEHLVVSKPNPADPSTWDWLPAIQAAVDASNAAKLDIQNSTIPEIGTRSIVQPLVRLPVGEGYGFYRVTAEIQAWQASGSWTSLNIAGPEGLGAFLAADDGAGGISQAFDIISGDNGAVFPGYQSSIRNIHFIGGRNHIRLVSANIDNRKIHIKGCSHSWNDPDFYAIHIDARSTYLHIEDPRNTNCPRYLYLNHVDRAQLDGGWINGYIDGTTGKPADSASISLNGLISQGPSRLAIRGTIFIPEPQGITQNALTRWIDLNDDCAVDIRDAHFGLENAGYPIVFVNTPLDSVSVNPFHSDARVTMDCVTGGSGGTSRVDRGLVVLRKGVPHITSLKNVSRVAGGVLINSVNMIDGVGSPTTLAAYLASLTGSNRPMLSVTIDGVMAWDTQDVPLELRKYLAGNIPTTHPSGTFPSSSIQPASRVNGFLTSSVADNSTVTVNFPAQFGIMIITADDGGVAGSNRTGSSVAVAYSSQAASAASQTLWDGTFGDVAAVDTDLTGTTGVDGNFTLSVKQGRVFEIENRLGFSCQFRVLFLNTQEY